MSGLIINEQRAYAPGGISNLEAEIARLEQPPPSEAASGQEQK